MIKKGCPRGKTIKGNLTRREYGPYTVQLSHPIQMEPSSGRYSEGGGGGGGGRFVLQC